MTCHRRMLLAFQIPFCTRSVPLFTFQACLFRKVFLHPSGNASRAPHHHSFLSQDGCGEKKLWEIRVKRAASPHFQCRVSWHQEPSAPPGCVGLTLGLRPDMKTDDWSVSRSYLTWKGTSMATWHLDKTDIKQVWKREIRVFLLGSSWDPHVWSHLTVPKGFLEKQRHQEDFSQLEPVLWVYWNLCK